MSSKTDVEIKFIKNIFVKIQQICIYQHVHYGLGNIFTGLLRILQRIVIFFFLDKLRTRTFGEQQFPNYVYLLQLMTMLRWTLFSLSATIRKRNNISSFWYFIRVKTCKNSYELHNDCIVWLIFSCFCNDKPCLFLVPYHLTMVEVFGTVYSHKT